MVRAEDVGGGGEVSGEGGEEGFGGEMTLIVAGLQR